MISEREAAGVLAGRGVGREQARRLLLAGAAGAGRRVGGCTAYEDERVRALAAAPAVDLDALAEECPDGVYVARLRRGLAFDCAWPWRRRAEAVAVQPAMPPMTRALVVTAPIAASGGLAWVATVSGFVVLAATATGGHTADDGRTVFALGPAGPWRASVEGRWWPTPPGRPWYRWHPGSAADHG